MSKVIPLVIGCAAPYSMKKGGIRKLKIYLHKVCGVKRKGDWGKEQWNDTWWQSPKKLL